MPSDPADSAQRIRLGEGADAYDVTVLPAASPTRGVLFAAGGGGDPTRHRPLLMALAAAGCTVVAPHIERLTTPVPPDSHLLQRAHRLHGALALLPPGLPVAGVGHSLGAGMLLAVAGARMRTLSGQSLSVTAIPRLDRLVLLAPTTDFYQLPGALDAVHAPILAWAGTQDAITPVMHCTRLQQRLEGRVPVDVRIVEGAGHFAFMDIPPPNIAPFPDPAFLGNLHAEVVRFVLSDISHP